MAPPTQAHHFTGHQGGTFLTENFHQFPFTCAPRLKNATGSSNDSHMDGQLKSSSSLA